MRVWEEELGFGVTCNVHDALLAVHHLQPYFLDFTEKETDWFAFQAQRDEDGGHEMKGVIVYIPYLYRIFNKIFSLKDTHSEDMHIVWCEHIR